MEKSSFFKKINIFKKWFSWLQKDNPVGDVVFYPEINTGGETSVKGVYIVGDLTGIPLLKFATTKSKDLVTKFGPSKNWGTPSATFVEWEKSSSKNKNHENKQKETYDLVIIGAGPAGIAAAIEAQTLGLNYIVLESSQRAFNTIQNFPKGKPMFYEPEDLKENTPLTMKGETKEELVDHLSSVYQKHKINVRYDQKVDGISSMGQGENIITTASHAYAARKTVLAIGKSGNARRLNVPGEDLEHVFNKLYDPGEFKNKKILVVGGGDTALESAILLAKAKNHVTISYRKENFSRPKPGNINMVNKLAKEGSIELLYNSEVKKITKNEVSFLVNKKDTIKKPFDNVFVMIGTQLPYEFFAKSGIKIANAKTHMTWWWLAFSIAFMNIVYFGKASFALNTSNGFLNAIKSIFSQNLGANIITLVAWISVLILIITGIVVIYDTVKKWKYYFQTKWSYIKYGYFFFVVTFFLAIFFGNKYFHINMWNKDPYFWYAFLYTTTIALFGIRRITVTKKKYVTVQTITLFLIQALPLFFIPNFVLPWMNNMGWIHPWIVEHIFLGGEWWRFVGFILAWPLFFWNIFTNEPSFFWLIVSLIQTFLIIPFIVIKWGKGAYCSWVCSCGALAETLGDEYRTLAPHGAKAKKWENAGQIILLIIFIVTGLQILGWIPTFSNALSGINTILMGGYQIFVDTFLAGTLGVGLYFFFSGRMWCRFYCPLAALMHIYNKFSTWGILADKKKCISCGLCTKSCHMGIDVMGFAQRGQTLNDVECVNCSACVNVCPTGVLSFGKYKKLWGNKK